MAIFPAIRSLPDMCIRVGTISMIVAAKLQCSDSFFAAPAVEYSRLHFHRPAGDPQLSVHIHITTQVAVSLGKSFLFFPRRSGLWANFL